MLLVLAAPAWAGKISDPICTDRPGKGSATCAVPKGVWQVETSLAGWSLTKVGDTRSTSLVIGESSIKYGLGDNTHIEVALAPYIRNRDRVGDEHNTRGGFGDVTIKVKHELTADGTALSAAFYPFVKLPTASKRIGNGKVEGGVIVPLSWSIGSTPLSLSSSPEIDVVADGDGNGYHIAGAGTLGLGVAAGDRLSLAVELWSGWDWDEDTTRQASLGTNAAYKITDGLQIDGEVDLGLTRHSADVEIVGGVSVRF